MGAHEIEKILSYVREYPGAKVKLAICDLDGILRGKVIHKDKFMAVVDKGFGFCNVVFGWDSADASYEGIDFTGWHTGYPDIAAQIDIATFRKIPWENNMPFFLGMKSCRAFDAISSSSRCSGLSGKDPSTAFGSRMNTGL